LVTLGNYSLKKLRLLLNPTHPLFLVVCDVIKVSLFFFLN